LNAPIRCHADIFVCADLWLARSAGASSGSNASSPVSACAAARSCSPAPTGSRVTVATTSPLSPGQRCSRNSSRSGSIKAAAVQALLGELPSTLGKASRARRRPLFKTGSEYWVVSSAEEEVTGQLQSVVAPEIGAVASLSHSRTRLFIGGPAARLVLSTGIALDLHPDSFPVGAFALTGVHHTPVFLHRAASDRYQLYVLRTFVEWVWEWLPDAALPFGYKVTPLSRRAI
jgi:methylglutamate dehydrogenase subunit D